MGVEVVGFRVLGVGRNGPGLWVPGAFGFRFPGFRFRVSGSEFKVQGSGSEFRISGLGLTLWGFVTWRMYVSSGRSPWMELRGWGPGFRAFGSRLSAFV